ncbi:hypothetical protein THAOC_27726, partial [Thalassiosira oceanica]
MCARAHELYAASLRAWKEGYDYIASLRVRRGQCYTKDADCGAFFPDWAPRAHLPTNDTNKTRCAEAPFGPPPPQDRIGLATAIRRPWPQPPESEDWGRPPRGGEDGFLPYHLALASILAVKWA